MAKSLLLTLLLFGAAPPADLEAEGLGPAPHLAIRVFDYAGVPGASFAKAQKEADRILQRTGIVSTWTPCLVRTDGAPNDPICTAKTRPTDLIVRILPKEMDGFENPSELGVAFIPLDGAFGKRASVFYNRAREYAERWQASEGLLLGHLIAQELGHLLLGANSHSRSGIMSARWNRDKVASASLGTLLFTQDEAARMRQQLAERILAGGGPKAAVADGGF